ncbi:MAG: hypothetical protein ACI9DM_000249 [Cyclobacteriaceae bacterium]|jgi:hypothetical protein
MGYLDIPIDFEKYKKDTYGGLDWNVLKDYQREDDYVEYHEDDKDLDTIRVYLPTSPDWRLIDGYGLPAKDQLFHRQKMPYKLDVLYDDFMRRKEESGDDDEDDSATLKELWSFITSNQIEYKEEIAWMRKMWYYILFGYWCFINGKPTFIEGFHFAHLNFGKMDIGHPKFRDRDRRWWIAIMHFEKTTEAPFHFKATWFEDKKLKTKYFGTEKQADEYETYLQTESETYGYGFSQYSVTNGIWIVDMKSRTVIGINYPKHRREGATYRADWYLLLKTLITLNARSGILSMDKIHGKRAFTDHTMMPFRELPWWMKAEYEGSDNAKQELSLKPKAQQVTKKGAHAVSKKGLGSMIDFSTTASEMYYDQTKLLVLHEDECGKTVLRDVYAGHDNSKNCLGLGDGSEMVGFTVKTSTVGEMTKKGGANFYKLCNASKYHERNALGMTTTMLVTLFMPAHDGLQGFIGPYGESIIDKPTPQQEEFIGRDYGAKMHLKIKEQQLRTSNDPKAMKDLNEHLRLHPTKYRDCFRKNTSDVGFNIAVLNDRINELEFSPTATQKGYFDFDQNDQMVYWVEDKKKALWHNSLVLPFDATNKFVRDGDGNFVPDNGKKFIASGDPFKFNKTEYNRLSDMSGSIFMNRDYLIDDSETPITKWESHRFVADYVDRPADSDEGNLQLLYGCMYYGCMISPEINVPDIWKFFERTYNHNFLYYFKNESTGKIKNTPGFNSQTGSKNDIFNCWRDYIEKHGRRDKHLRQLAECADIDGIEEMTFYDQFTAGGGCLITADNMNPPRGIQNNMNNPVEHDDDYVDLSDWYDNL